MAPPRKPNSPPASLAGAIKLLREWAQKAVDTHNNRDVWELAYQLFTPDCCQVLRIQPKPWVPPGEGDFQYQTKAAAQYREQRSQHRDNPYRPPKDGVLHLTVSQQEKLKSITEGIAERAKQSDKLREEALAAQRERDELVAQSVKNREFLELRERMVSLAGDSGIFIPELSVSLINTQGEAIDESLVHMTEVPETSTPLPTKKGKALKAKASKNSKKVASKLVSVEPSPGATVDLPPTGRIETLKAAKQVLARAVGAATPEHQSTTIDEDIAAISGLVSPISESYPAKKKERIAHVSKSLFGDTEDSV